MGLPSFVDGWERELVFYNAPTALLRPNGNQDTSGGPPNPPVREPINRTDYDNARTLITTLPSFSVSGATLAWDDYTSPLNIDPLDPYGTIGTSPANDDESTFERLIHAIDTYYTPLIISPGPDGETGLFAPDDTDNGGGVDSDVHRRLGKIDPSRIERIYDNLTNQQRGGF
ncbi:MAG: hypothetical protein R3B90_17730 [Planctomycetaceae bacterium]